VFDKAMQQIRDRGLDLKIAMYCDGPTEIKAAVRQNMGVGMVYEDAIKSEVSSGEFKLLKVPGIELEGESSIIYSKKRKLSSLALEFLELLRSERMKGRELDMTGSRAPRPVGRMANRITPMVSIAPE